MKYPGVLCSALGIASLGVAVCTNVALAIGSGIRDVDWTRVTIPATVCKTIKPVALHGGSGSGMSDFWPGQTKSERIGVAAPTPPTIDEVAVDGTEAATLLVNCNNGNGMIAGVIAYRLVVFEMTNGALRLRATIAPVIQMSYGRNATIPDLLRIESGSRFIIAESFYGSEEGSCCPSGRAISTWRMTKAGLKHVRTVVTKLPYGVTADGNRLGGT